jgi:hypothetical protein
MRPKRPALLDGVALRAAPPGSRAAAAPRGLRPGEEILQEIGVPRGARRRGRVAHDGIVDAWDVVERNEAASAPVDADRLGLVHGTSASADPSAVVDTTLTSASSCPRLQWAHPCGWRSDHTARIVASRPSRIASRYARARDSLEPVAEPSRTASYVAFGRRRPRMHERVALVRSGRREEHVGDRRDAGLLGRPPASAAVRPTSVRTERTRSVGVSERSGTAGGGSSTRALRSSSSFRSASPRRAAPRAKDGVLPSGASAFASACSEERTFRTADPRGPGGGADPCAPPGTASARRRATRRPSSDLCPSRIPSRRRPTRPRPIRPTRGAGSSRARQSLQGRTRREPVSRERRVSDSRRVRAPASGRRRAAAR